MGTGINTALTFIARALLALTVWWLFMALVQS